MTLLSVSHKKQRQPADCLAACAAMVLEYLQVSVAYNDIVEQFETRYFGAPFFNVHKLEAMGLFVGTGEWGELNTIKAYLQKGCLYWLMFRRLNYIHTGNVKQVMWSS